MSRNSKTTDRAQILGAIVLLAAATATRAQERPSSFAPATPALTAAEIVSQPSNYEQPASDGLFELFIESSCSKTRQARSDTVVTWDAGGAAAGELRVDITGYNNGFSTGRYVTSGVRSAERRKLTYLNAEAGVYYYWRLLTRASNGWVVRANGRFDAPTCPADPVSE